MKDSRIPRLYRMTVSERIDALVERNWLDAGAAALLRRRATLSGETADRMIENVIGVFGLPLAVAPNFRINGRDYVVPMAVEEPSIVAAVSGAAKLARSCGGFEASAGESLLAGQILLTGLADMEGAFSVLESAREELVEAANALQPNLVSRGGGARDVEFFLTQLPRHVGSGKENLQSAVVIHLLVDTRDAMGANTVNSMCEGIAPRIERMVSGRAVLKILSNLADRSIVTARTTILLSELGAPGHAPATVRDGVILATDFARTNPYRAATHNKGIMNGIDAVAIATGNDWRSIEASAHAYAARDGAYRSLTTWSMDAAGNLVGELVLPLKVGTVGGSLQANPAVQVGLHLIGAESAGELAAVMAAVGLAQNFAALRALVTSGIQEGHMALHARSVAASAGIPPRHFDHVVGELVASRDIKMRKARELLAAISQEDAGAGEASGGLDEVHGFAAGKVILLGEHAAVYGRHVLALPLPRAVEASVREGTGETTWVFRDPGGEHRWSRCEAPAVLPKMLDLILEQLGLAGKAFDIRLHSGIPRSAGLGSSAAVAVALLRAFDRVCGLGLDDSRVNELAYECEKLAHGDPSGIDNTVATFARPALFRKGSAPEILSPNTAPPLVIATGGARGSTREQVALVRRRHGKMRAHYEAIFDEIGRISVEGASALARGNFASLGDLMNVCHGLLNALGVSTPELEHMVEIARRNGAAGAKLTGAGGGGSIVALCPGTGEGVRQALVEAGYTLVNQG